MFKVYFIIHHTSAARRYGPTQRWRWHSKGTSQEYRRDNMGRYDD